MKKNFPFGPYTGITVIGIFLFSLTVYRDKAPLENYIYISLIVSAFYAVIYIYEKYKNK